MKNISGILEPNKNSNCYYECDTKKVPSVDSNPDCQMVFDLFIDSLGGESVFIFIIILSIFLVIIMIYIIVQKTNSKYQTIDKIIERAEKNANEEIQLFEDPKMGTNFVFTGNVLSIISNSGL